MNALEIICRYKVTLMVAIRQDLHRQTNEQKKPNGTFTDVRSCNHMKLFSKINFISFYLEFKYINVLVSDFQRSVWSVQSISVACPCIR